MTGVQTCALPIYIKTASDEAENKQQAKTSKTIDFDFDDVEKTRE